MVEELSALDGKEIQTIFEEPVGNIDWVKVLSPRPPRENQPPPSPKIGDATQEKEITDIPVINLEQLCVFKNFIQLMSEVNCICTCICMLKTLIQN